jgi:hypothetical protein
MKERFTDIPKNQNFGRAEGGQTPFSADREQQEKTRENIRNMRDYKHPSWFRSSRKGTLTEIRDILRRQEISREFEEMVAFRARLNEKIDRKKEEALAGTPEGEEKLTIGKLVLAILAAILSAPADIAEQTAKDAQEQAKKAA